ncbi:MAG: DUF421 domain-containing protein [Flavobacterium psychrophilum]
MNEYLDIVVRSLGVYFFMLLALRVFGKKELSQLNTADIILILLISNAVQNAMVGNNTSLSGGITAALVLFVVNFGLKKLLYKFPQLNALIQEKPVVLIHEGKADYKALANLSISSDELHEAIREHGLEHYTEVKLALLEMDGNISIISGQQNLKQTHYKRRHNRKNLASKN